MQEMSVDISVPIEKTDHSPSKFQRIFTPLQTCAVLITGALGSLVAGLQPLLLGPLASAGRLTMREVGITAMLETFGMAAIVAVAAVLFRPRGLKLILFLAAIAALAANAIAFVSSHEVIMAARLLNGLAGGVMLWVWTGLLTNVALPSRLFSIYLGLQGAGALVLSYLFSTVITPAWGPSGGYAVLGLLGVVPILLSFFAPSEYPDSATETGEGFRFPGIRGFFGLLAVAMHLAAIMAIWVYVLPLGQQFGIPNDIASLTVTVGLLVQIIGASSAAILARMRATYALYVSIGASLLSLALTGLGGTEATFTGGLALLCFFWTFAPGFQMSYILDIDPSRRAGMQIVTFQLLGLSAGPALASLFVNNGNAAPAIVVSAALYVSALIIVILTTNVALRRS